MANYMENPDSVIQNLDYLVFQMNKEDVVQVSDGGRLL